MSKSGGSSKSTTNTVAEPWKGVQPFMTQGYQELAGLYGTPSFDRKGNLADWQYNGQGPQYYPGQTIVNPNGLENYGQELQLGNLGAANWISSMSNAGLQSLFQAPGQTNRGLDYAKGGAENLLGYATGGTARGGEFGALGAMQDLMKAGDPSTNPYFQSAMASAMRPVTEQFQEQVLPSIRRGAVGAGQAGGSRQGIAEGIAARGYTDTMGDIAANMGNQAYGQGLQALQAAGGIGQGLLGMGLNAAGTASGLGQGIYDSGLTAAGRGAALAPQVQGMNFVPGQVAEGIGQQRTADQQSQVDADMARWNYNQQLPYSMMSDYLTMLQGAPGGTTASTMASPQTGSLLGRIGGGALAGYGMGGGYGALAGGLLGLF